MYFTIIGAVTCGMSLSGPIFASCTAERNIGPHDGAYDPRQPQPGLLDRRGQCLDGPGARELLIGGVQVGDAARQPLLARIGRHKITSPSIGLISLCNNNSTVGRTGRIASQGAGRPDVPLAAQCAFEVGRYTKIATGGKSLIGVRLWPSLFSLAQACVDCAGIGCRLVGTAGESCGSPPAPELAVKAAG